MHVSLYNALQTRLPFYLELARKASCLLMLVFNNLTFAAAIDGLPFLGEPFFIVLRIDTILKTQNTNDFTTF